MGQAENPRCNSPPNDAATSSHVWKSSNEIISNIRKSNKQFKRSSGQERAPDDQISDQNIDIRQNKISYRERTGEQLTGTTERADHEQSVRNVRQETNPQSNDQVDNNSQKQRLQKAQLERNGQPFDEVTQGLNLLSVAGNEGRHFG